MCHLVEFNIIVTYRKAEEDAALLPIKNKIFFNLKCRQGHMEYSKEILEPHELSSAISNSQ